MALEARRSVARPVLQSWKEIAAYLGVSPRTAQSYEDLHGLPVHRLHGQRGRVIAYPDELDTWRESAARPPEEEEPRRWGWWALGGVFVVLVAGLGIWLWPRPAPPEFHSAHLVNGALVGYDTAGNVVWTHRFVPPLHEFEYSPAAPDRAFLWVGDLDGDGRKEVLFAVEMLSAQHSGELLCLAQDGSVRWSYVPKAAPQIGPRTIPALWNADSVAVGPRENGETGIWVSFRNRRSSPDAIARLNVRGEEQALYLHAGHVPCLMLWQSELSARPILLAGGISNRAGAATLIGLDPERLEGVSEEGGSPEEQLTGERRHAEIFRLFFPATLLGRSLHPYGQVRRVSLDSGRLRVHVNETPASTASVVVYDFDTALRLVRVSPDDSYFANYRQARARGLRLPESPMPGLAALARGLRFEPAPPQVRQ